MKSQGTELYFIDDQQTTPEVVTVGCITSIDGVDVQIEQNEITCLQDLVRRYEAGLGTPGTATFGIYTDPNDESHVRLLEIKNSGATLKWAIGWSDNVGQAPSLATPDTSGEDFNLPDDRSWLVFEGFMNSFSFSFQQNQSVQSSIGIQVSGNPQLVPRSST